MSRLQEAIDHLNAAAEHIETKRYLSMTLGKVAEALEEMNANHKTLAGRTGDAFGRIVDVERTTNDLLNKLSGWQQEVNERLHRIETWYQISAKDTTEEQSVVFQAWSDVVEIVGRAEVSPYDYIGMEGIITEESNGYKVHMAEIEDCAWFPASSLKLVYRLKPRQQPEPNYVGSVMFDVGTQPPSNEDLLRAAGYVQKPTPFQVGDWVHDSYDNFIYQVTEVTKDHLMGVDEQGKEYCTQARHATKISKPTSQFKVGDWVRDTLDGTRFKVSSFDAEYVYGTDEEGEGYTVRRICVAKAEPPAPRFTFGDRVRHRDDLDWILFVREHGKYADVCSRSGTVYEVFLNDLQLDNNER